MPLNEGEILPIVFLTAQEVNCFIAVNEQEADNIEPRLPTQMQTPYSLGHHAEHFRSHNIAFMKMNASLSKTLVSNSTFC